MSGNPRPVGRPRLPAAARRRRMVVAVLVAAGAIATLLAALWIGGGRPSAAPAGIPDPGAITGWGLPITTLLTNIAMVGTIGALVVGVLLAPAERGGQLSGVGLRCMTHASRWATVWLVGATAAAVFGVSELVAVPVSSLTAPMMHDYFSVQLGQAQLAVIAIAAVAAIAARRVLTLNGGILVLICASFALVPPSLTGHANIPGDHDLAVSSLLVHLVAASAWVGGLVAIVLAAGRSRRISSQLVPGFATLATWCWIAVGVSGVVNAHLRIGWGGKPWDSRYGWLVLVKLGCFIVLGGFGWWHRRHYVKAIAAQRDAPGFARFVVAELAVMAGTVAVATALSRTPTPPNPSAGRSPSALLLGYDVPPISARHLVFGARPDLLTLAALIAAVIMYYGGVRRLRRRGDRWPIGRSIAFGSGLLIVAYVLVGGLARYSQALFSAHMVAHMALTMLAPILLGLGAPITLALRALPTRTRSGGRSARQWLVVALHHPVTRVLSHPLVALALYVVTLYGLYFTPAFGWAMRSHSAHLVMHAHFLAVGCLYFWSILGIDPMPRKWPHLARIGMLAASMPFHAFFGITLMTGTTLLAGDWFSSLRLDWVGSLLADQQTGGGIAWAFSEIPTVLVLAAVFVHWFRSEEREAARRARHPQIDDAELAAYNDYLAELDRRERNQRT